MVKGNLQQEQPSVIADAQIAGQNHTPVISLPKGGGAIRGMGEKFATNPVTGTGSLTIPIVASPGRSEFGPRLSLDYDSGSGNGSFGLGWTLASPSITRKTDKGIPQYRDTKESDEFILSGAEDLVPVLVQDNGQWQREALALRGVDGTTYRIQRYRPRVEGLFARVERWTNQNDPADSFWRSISPGNITTWYGKTSNSRIVDPDEPARIFSWLICESHDDKGNVVVYDYKSEDSENIDLSMVHEANRTNSGRSTNRYLKGIRYGNLEPYYPVLNEAQPAHPLPLNWMFELIFDYGEHDKDTPLPFDDGVWQVRNDPFSSYRAGFEIRTYRLCQRILMFHHFPDEVNNSDASSSSEEFGVGSNCLVRSTDFNYRHEHEPASTVDPIHTVLDSVTQCAYKRLSDVSYRKRRLPPVEFEYSQAQIHETIQDIDPKGLENLPQGLDGTSYQWVDLDGEGLSGILTEQASCWHYKRNVSPTNVHVDDEGRARIQAQFTPMERLAAVPSYAGLRERGQQLLDLAGDGQLDVVVFDSSPPGFYERTHNEDWQPFRPFKSHPVVNWSDPNLKFVDLTGDGHADILITEHEALCWHPSLAEAGFGLPESVSKVLDENNGPNLVFDDGTQSVYLADLSGDGLTDLVRIRNGQVCYWPNLGYGHFGSKVTMDNAPWFDSSDHFDQRRIRLADIDGSGLTDIVYLNNEGVHIFYNHSGNSWSEARSLTHFPDINNLVSVQVFDLLGNGTACLVWSSPSPDNAQQSMRYVDLMGGQKPHLMIGSQNNLGAQTRIEYAPSTQFYVADQQAGKPWITRVPFPVHVVERVDTYDHISRNRFVTRYAYHHGYFDGVEREFRGFGMVEQWDTEEFTALNDSDVFPTGDNVEASSHVPPVYTKTWFHTGIYLGRQHVSNFFSGLLNATDTGEYYREPGLSDEQAFRLLLPDTVLPEGLSVNEEREACRTLKGAMLRQEVYALDGTDQQPHPYSVSEQNFNVRMLQPMVDGTHGVFHTYAREALSYQYERNPADPRISHTLTLEVDDYGNVLRSAAIGYGRRQPDPDLAMVDQQQQAKMLMTCSQNAYTNLIEEDDHHRTPLPCEVLSFELTGLVLQAGQRRFNFEQMLEAVQSAESIDYHQTPTEGIQIRVVEHARTLFRRNDLTDALPLGEMQSQALSFESYQLAFTPEHLSAIYGERVSDALLISEGRYVHSQGDSNWWIPSGRSFFAVNSAATSAEELNEAQLHFFTERRVQDPFGESMTVDFDNYDLLPVRTSDPLSNTVSASNDYRVLQPVQATDANGNRATIMFDTLGMVAGTAVMGKQNENLGDSLDGFAADLSQDQIDAFFDDSRGPIATELLGNASTRIIYDVNRFQRLGSSAPGLTATVSRESHVSDPTPADGLQIQVGLAYSDGFGRVIQSKAQVEPGSVEANGPVVDQRWVGSGWTVFNNKGEPVKQYEPFFSANHEFEFARIEGVSPTLFYDPVGRIVAILNPNHSWEKVVFSPWLQENWDVNDTVLVNPANDEHVGDYFRRLQVDEYLPTWHALRTDPAHAAQALARWPVAQQRQEEASAAVKASVHADTSNIVYLDSLGRPFLSIANNGLEGRYETRTEQDIEGVPLRVVDARGNAVMVYQTDTDVLDGQLVTGYDVAGRQIFEHSMDGGEQRVLMDVAGNPIRSWDSRGYTFRSRYDALRRLTHQFVQAENNQELLTEMSVYGEVHPAAENLNLRGQVYQQYDAAGVVTSELIDFKGNTIRGSRRLAREYRQTVDWSALSNLSDVVAIESAAENLLEADVFASEFQYDALDRPISIVTPDGSVTLPAYNEANLLKRLRVRLRGADQETPFVTNIDYDAKGQRERITYATRDGTNFTTRYEYEPDTFRLSRLLTQRNRDGTILQNLNYSYDPAGNITTIRDLIQQTVFFNNTEISPHCDYTYDALYRLIRAEGREHAAQNNVQRDANDMVPVIGIPFINSPEALQRYIEEYRYDEVGNILNMAHTGGADLRWRRCYQYALDSNRLLATGGAGEFQSVANPCPEHYVLAPTLSQRYAYDFHGNMIQMPHLPLMQWNHKDQLQATSRQVVNDGTSETTYYVYDAVGERVRKVTERMAGIGETPTRMHERIYLGGFEVYREFDGGGENIGLERETLHVLDDVQRVALVETLTTEDSMVLPEPTFIIRYQINNQLNSTLLEVDNLASLITYEEYHPFGTSALRTGRSLAEVSLKRYRYTGKEKEKETGLYYHGARYYASWLGIWTAADPIGVNGGLNLFVYSSNNPVLWIDPSGQAPESSDLQQQRGRDTRREARDLREQRKHSKEQDLAPDPMIEKEEDIKRQMEKAGKRAKTPIEGHHHADIAKASSVGASPDVVSKELTSVWSRKTDFSFGTIGDEPFSGDKKTPHNIAHAIDLDEQFKSPNTPAGLEDAAATSKWRFPATNDMKERAKYDWTRIGDTAKAGKAAKATIGPIGRFAADKLIKSLPIAGAAYTLFAPGEAGAGERVGRAIAGEIGIGPLDLESVYDASANMDAIAGWITGDYAEIERLDQLHGGVTAKRGSPGFIKLQRPSLWLKSGMTFDALDRPLPEFDIFELATAGGDGPRLFAPSIRMRF